MILSPLEATRKQLKVNRNLPRVSTEQNRTQARRKLISNWSTTLNRKTRREQSTVKFIFKLFNFPHGNHPLVLLIHIGSHPPSQGWIDQYGFAHPFWYSFIMSQKKKRRKPSRRKIHSGLLEGYLFVYPGSVKPHLCHFTGMDIYYVIY